MPLDPRTPVLVGAAAVQQRLDDPAEALEPVALMALALERAAEDAGAPALLTEASSIRIPRALWPYADPARLVRERIGAPRARTEVAEIGVLQTTLFGRAADAIARGDEDIVLLTGGEAKYRELVATRAGTQPTHAAQGAVEPDSVLRPHAEIYLDAEIEHGLIMPVSQYAIIENALRFAEGQSLDAHRASIAELYATMSRVAAANPDAWIRTPSSAADIATPSGANRPLAFPYTKRHCSHWNVDQAAGLILCSLETADRLGIADARRIFPLAVTESNHMVPVAARPLLHRSPGFAHAGRRAAEIAGIALADVEHVELYSCFPVAVRVQQRELGLADARPVTETGGMAFAGGPLNNFVLQAMAKMADVLRQDPGTRGLVTAVSGMLTKQGVSLWSSAPPEHPCRFEEVTELAASEVTPLRVEKSHDGPATVASYTVLYEGDSPSTGVLLCDLDSGDRAVAATRDPDALARLTTTEVCGQRVAVAGGTATL